MVLVALAPAQDAPFELVDAELDAPRAGEVLVRIAGAGICHTDVAVVAQHIPLGLPAVLGHEGAGIVVAVGAGVSKVRPGDHVVLTFNSCGVCEYCASRKPSYCPQKVPLNYGGGRPSDGSSTIHVHGEPVGSCFYTQSSFADHALAHERNTIPIDKEVPIELMGPLACGVQTGAGAIMRALAVPAGSSLLVTGGGTVGLSAVMAAVLQGCSTIIVSEPHPERRALAKELGATHTIDPIGGDLNQLVREILPSGVQFAFDTTGRADIIATAIDALATRGAIGLVGVAEDFATPLSTNMMAVVSRGITIRGVSEGDSEPDTYIPELVAHFKAGRFPIDKLCKTYPLTEINRAVDDQLAGRCVKPVLIP
jgi:aryl-alcohol dehydrogenase